MRKNATEQTFMTTGKMWLAAGLASVLAACASMGGAPSAEQAAWPTKANVVATQSAFTPAGLASLDARMKEAVDKGEVAGLEYALIKDGKVVALNVFGNQAYGGPAMQEETIFRIRSMTKPVTGVAMMQLWEQGKWKPEDPVTKFLPELGNLKVATSTADLNTLVPASRTPSMNEIMTHTAGFGYGLSANNAVDRAFLEKHPMYEKDLAALVTRTSQIPLLDQPGNRWSYSIVVDLQGAIIEKITGKKFGDYLEQNIFAPLAMKDTGFWLTEQDRPRVATVYARNAKTNTFDVLEDKNSFTHDFYTANSQAESGGGGLVSTLHDYVRFTQMLLNKGELDGKRILKPETVNYMMQNHIGDLKGVIGGGAFGYGGMVVVNDPTEKAPQPKGTFSWFGIDGTWFWVDPSNNLAFVGMIQRRGPAGAGGIDVRGESAQLVYKALAK
ncbi:MAG TPA: serine hydrolase domain-containing protein [Hyphomonadaceae bacterium]|nr:serine hydrolase domain-containing protein [Hyphomonadaceae bacterium]HPI46929.1 serine hydrolase domain-containing protein [Hyphomonadaceae bacterium]